VRFPFWRALAGSLRVSEVRVERARLAVRRSADGRDNISDLMPRLRGRGGGRRGGGTAEPAPTLVMQNGSVEIVDEERAIWVKAADVDGRVEPRTPAQLALSGVARQGRGRSRGGCREVDRPRAPHAARSGGELPTLELSGGILAPLHSLALTGIRGTITPAADSGRATVDLRGGYGGVPEEVWTATGEVLPHERTAQLDVTAARFTLDKLRPVLKDTR